jgi:hypothetical protein
MRIIDNIVIFCITLIVGIKVQEKTMDILYPNRPKGILRNLIYNWESVHKKEIGGDDLKQLQKEIGGETHE